jgi:hypothetical protein
MANDFEIKSLHWETQSGGHSDGSDERRHRRELRMRALFNALQTGPIDAARLAFTALIASDADLAHNASLGRIGAALQSSNLALALRLAIDMQADNPKAFKGFGLPTRAPDNSTKAPAKTGFVGGFTGRFFDVSA